MHRGRVRSGKNRETLKTLLTVATVAIVVLAGRSSLADHYTVPSGSMLPTVEEGDRIVVDKLAYGFRLPFSRLYLTRPAEPAPGDVVVLASPVDGTTLLKRVVGGPGDVVEVVGGRVILNGRPLPVRESGGALTESIGAADHRVLLTNAGGPAWGPRRIPEDLFLVVGDNRGDSHDGRLFGLVERGAIRGRAAAVYYSSGFTWRPL